MGPRKLLKGAACALLLSAAPLFAALDRAHGEETADWERIADDLSIARVTLWPSAIFSPELFFVRTSLRRYRVGVVRAADFGLRNANVQSLSKAAHYVVGINANFFDERGKPLGLVMSRGITHSQMHQGGKALSGIFQVTGNGVALVNRSDFNARFVTEAVQAGPRLLVQGTPVVTGQRSPYSRRAGVCIDKQGRLLLYISSGLVGITMPQVQELLRSQAIGCTDALNLDGGGSAQLYISKQLPDATGQMEEVLIQGRDEIPVVLGLFVKS